uniref:Uncharacterized protein n=1 Tax=Globodera rostochiensis TaxID=31243 RepID=A0A914GSJ6_GLORO
MKLNILQLICLINYVFTFPNDLFDELWETNQPEPQANNNPIESQPKIKVESNEEQFDGRWQDESALKGNVKAEHEPHYGAVKVEDKIKHESADELDQENSKEAKLLSDQNNSTDQDESVDEQQNEGHSAVNCRASPFLSSFQNTMPSALSSMPSSVYALSAAPSSHPSYLYHGSDGPPPPPHSSSAALSPTLTPIPQQQLLQSPVIQQMLLMNSNNNSGSITNKTVEIATKMITATNNQFHQQLAPSASASYKPHNQLAQQSPLDSSSPCSSSSSFPQTPHQYAVVPPPPIRLGSPPKPRRKRNMAMCDDGSNSEHCFETENGGPASIINRINHDKCDEICGKRSKNAHKSPKLDQCRTERCTTPEIILKWRMTEEKERDIEGINIAVDIPAVERHTASHLISKRTCERTAAKSRSDATGRTAAGALHEVMSSPDITDATPATGPSSVLIVLVKCDSLVRTI